MPICMPVPVPAASSSTTLARLCLACSSWVRVRRGCARPCAPGRPQSSNVYKGVTQVKRERRRAGGGARNEMKEREKQIRMPLLRGWRSSWSKT
eukprot:6184475-Pleurochrysis_carterae.AAC.1